MASLIRVEACGATVQAVTAKQELAEQDRADQPADRQEAREAAAQLGEVHIQHHHHEQEQHHHRADIDDDENHRQELGAEQYEEAGRVEESEDQEQHRMHGIAHGDDHQPRADGHDGEDVEEEPGKTHWGTSIPDFMIPSV